MEIADIMVFFWGKGIDDSKQLGYKRNVTNALKNCAKYFVLNLKNRVKTTQRTNSIYVAMKARNRLKTEKNKVQTYLDTM